MKEELENVNYVNNYFVYFIIILFFFSCSEPPKNIGESHNNAQEINRHKYEKKLRSSYQSKETTSSLEDVFSYQVPKGWERKPSTQFRLFNFSAGKTVESYLHFSKGSAGGVLANVNRWRRQFALGAVNEQNLSNHLQTISFFGRKAQYVDLSGDYTSMQGKFYKNWRMLGVLLISEQFSFFVKMTGRADEVAQQKENFEKFCKSFGVKKQKVSSRHSSHPKGLHLHFGSSWKVVITKNKMTYLTATKNDIRATVTRLRGTGGGVKANYLRWARQFGVKDVPSYESFPKVRILGKLYPLIKFTGNYKGMGKSVKIAQATLLGVIIPLQDETIFVKLIAPSNQVSSQVVQEFKSALRSLHF